MRQESPPEMKKLLMKYRSGSVPPLVAKDNGNDCGLLKEEFLDIFEKEIDEITQFHRETNFSKRKNTTFRKASIDFLENVFYERD